MQQLIILIVALALAGGVYLFLTISKKKSKEQTEENAVEMMTANEMINEIGGMSMELFSESEKLAYCKNITSIVSRFQFPYKYMAISSPYVIKHMVTADRNRLKNASGLCKQISAYAGIRLGVENKQHRRNYRKLYKHTDYRNEYRRTAIENNQCFTCRSREYP